MWVSHRHKKSLPVVRLYVYKTNKEKRSNIDFSRHETLDTAPRQIVLLCIDLYSWTQLTTVGAARSFLLQRSNQILEFARSGTSVRIVSGSAQDTEDIPEQSQAVIFTR